MAKILWFELGTSTSRENARERAKQHIIPYNIVLNNLCLCTFESAAEHLLPRGHLPVRNGDWQCTETQHSSVRPALPSLGTFPSDSLSHTIVSQVPVVPHSSQKHPLCLMESSQISLSIIFKDNSKPATCNFLPWLRPSFCWERSLLYICYQEAPIGLLFAIAKG